MNTFELKPSTNTLGWLWKRYQVWRAMRMLRRIPVMREEAQAMLAEAQRLLRENTIPPAGPLFDGLGDR